MSGEHAFEAGRTPTVYVMPIPLRPDLNAQVQIPYDLTEAEARKIGAVLLALAKDEPVEP